MTVTQRLWAVIDWFVPSEWRNSTIDLVRSRTLVAASFTAATAYAAIAGARFNIIAADPAWVITVVCICVLLFLIPFFFRLTRSLTVIGAAVSIAALLGAPAIGYLNGIFPAPILLVFPFFPLAVILVGGWRMAVLAAVGSAAGIMFVMQASDLATPVILDEHWKNAFAITAVGMTLLTCALALSYEYIIRRSFTELEQLASELRQLKEQAEAASEAKSIFLAKMSHEMRTPLTVILALASMHAERSDLPEDLQDDLGAIGSSAENLNALMNNVLDMARIEAGKIELDLGPSDFRRWLEGVRPTLVSFADQHGVSLQLRVDPEIPPVTMLDEPKLTQILTNLVTNAVRYSNDGDEVRVEFDREGRVLIMSVIDGGPGIPREHLERIFSPFERVSDRTTTPGLGLGLAICRELTELLGGRIAVRSEVGKGSCFEVRLPLNDSELPNAKAPNLSSIGRHQTVLIVDDNDLVLSAMTSLLAKYGVRVLSADGGHAALAIATAEVEAGRSLDLVILDMHMPELSGPETAALFKAAPALAKVPIVALSADVLRENVEKAKAAGVEEYFGKPISRGTLDQLISRYLAPADAPAARSSPAA